MSQQKRIMLAVAGAGAFGAAFYASRGRRSQDNQQSSNKARDKRDMGLQGAGIGMTGAAGGNERAIDPIKDRKVNTTAPPEKFPPAGLGGGAGAGGPSARAIELPMGANPEREVAKTSAKVGRTKTNLSRDVC